MDTLNNSFELTLVGQPLQQPNSEKIKPSENNVTINSSQAEQTNSPSYASENPKEIENAVSEINNFLQVVQRNLQFTLDDESGKMVVQIKDEDGKVIKQLPSEEALELARRLDEFSGLLFKEEA